MLCIHPQDFSHVALCCISRLIKRPSLAHGERSKTALFHCRSPTGERLRPPHT